MTTGCYRYQFIEAIMRVAKAKFYDTGLAKTFSKALKMLLDDHCLKFGPTKEWQDFRDKEWWNYETHKILEVNQF